MRISVARRIAVGCLAAGSLAVAPAVAGAKTKSPSGLFKLPAGETFTLSNTSLSGCDPLSYGYKIGSQKRVTLGSNNGSCAVVPQATATIGPFAKNVQFRLFLKDSIVSPPFTFRSTNLNHTTITDNGDGSYLIQTGDGKDGAAPPSVVYHNSNFSTDLTISAPAS